MFGMRDINNLCKTTVIFYKLHDSEDIPYLSFKLLLPTFIMWLDFELMHVT